MTKFECFECKKVFDTNEGIWINNGGSWSMVMVCKGCYKND